MGSGGTPLQAGQGLDVESDDDALFPAGSDADETDRLTLGEVLVSVTAVRGTLFDAFLQMTEHALQQETHGAARVLVVCP
jgi:hypothetical protein